MALTKLLNDRDRHVRYTEEEKGFAKTVSCGPEADPPFARLRKAYRIAGMVGIPTGPAHTRSIECHGLVMTPGDALW